MIIRSIACLVLVSVLGCDSGGGTEVKPSSGDKAAPESNSDEGYGFDDLPDCSELIEKMEECGDKESSIASKRDGIQKDIDKGLPKDTVNNKCSIGNKSYRCSNKNRDKSAKDDDSEKDTARTEETSEGEFGIAACDDYVKMVGECKTFKRDSAVFKGLLKRWREAIDEGKSSDVEEKCKKAAELFRCPKK